MSYPAVIGLEVHVQLKTETKIFCRCPNRFDAPPNTSTCPACLGLPGAMPVLSEDAVDLGVSLSAALELTLHSESTFDRKSYFYPDLPKGYQITQAVRPLATDGRLPLTRSDKTVGIERLHLEEDTGRLHHDRGSARVDFNRAGVPLAEIVSRPEIRTPREAEDFLRTLHQVLLYTDTSDGSLAEGSLRCDANVSLRSGGGAAGGRIEIKNLNSFKHVAQALEHEIERQGRILDAGGRVERETRGFDEGTGRTYGLRSKEETADYRFLPEPDLPLLALDPHRVEHLRSRLPELPWRIRRRFREDWGLDPETARIMTRSRELAAFFEDAARSSRAPRRVAGWIRTEGLRWMGSEEADVPPVPPDHLADLVALVEDGRLSHTAAKTVFEEIAGVGEPPAEAMERLGLAQVSDKERLDAWVRSALGEHPEEARRLRSGDVELLGWFMGRVMQKSDGRADPREARRRLQAAVQAADPVEDAS